jgi:hypothetical protein
MKSADCSRRFTRRGVEVLSGVAISIGFLALSLKLASAQLATFQCPEGDRTDLLYQVEC